MDLSDRKSFENCSQLVNLIRYQLGDPQEFVNKCHFSTGFYFAFAESNNDYYSKDKGAPFRHSINFAWVILGQHFSAKLMGPEITSPLISIDGCQRQWRLTMKAFRDRGNLAVEYDVYLKCTYCEDASIRACVRMDLYKATEQIGADALTNVTFDHVVNRHVVYTSMVKESGEETRATNEDLSQAFTIQGILNVSHCCDDHKLLPHLKPGFITRY